jgi:tryptophan synthase alpha chain
MCYANLIYARGTERFLDALASAGGSGLIVPDLPLEEAEEVSAAADRAGIALVPLVAPTTPPERLARIGARARGFVYTVSLTGTTGERTAMADTFGEVVAQAAAAGADGVIVGSRLVRAAAEARDAPSAVRELVAGLADALRR